MIDECMSDSRRAHPALLTPRSPIEDSSHGSKHDVSPVEVHRALVEMREPEENSRRQQNRVPHISILRCGHRAKHDRFL
jgi:hypothetical protein